MRPTYEEGRYITLMGDPIGPNGPASPTDPKSFWKCPDIKTTGVVTALCATFNAAAGQPDADVLNATLMCAFFGGVDVLMWRAIQKIHMSFSGLKDAVNESKCIDTRPDRTTPPTLERYGLAAHRVKKTSASLTGVLVAIDALAFFSKAAGSPIAAANFMANSTVKYARILGAWKRFDKVSTGEWVIVDMPKPQIATVDLVPREVRI